MSLTVERDAQINFQTLDKESNSCQCHLLTHYLGNQPVQSDEGAAGQSFIVNQGNQERHIATEQTVLHLNLKLTQ